MNGLMIWKMFQLPQLARLITLSAILAALNSCGGAKSNQTNVIVRDTLVVTKERVLHDTLMIQKDTIVYQDRVRVELKYLPGERVMIKAECPSDTIRVETIKIVNREAPKGKGISWEALAGWIIALLSLLVIIKSVINKLL